MKNVFQKIIDGELPCDKVFENERILAIKDKYPVAPVHLLIIAKKLIPDLATIAEADGPLMGEMMLVAKKLAHEYGVEKGFRLLTNIGPSAGQSIFHLHFHLIGGRPLGPMA